MGNKDNIIPKNSALNIDYFKKNTKNNNKVHLSALKNKLLSDLPDDKKITKKTQYESEMQSTQASSNDFKDNKSTLDFFKKAGLKVERENDVMPEEPKFKLTGAGQEIDAQKIVDRHAWNPLKYDSQQLNDTELRRADCELGNILKKRQQEGMEALKQEQKARDSKNTGISQAKNKFNNIKIEKSGENKQIGFNKITSSVDRNPFNQRRGR